MGSFNTSCFASHQTIAPGDKCRVLPIFQRKDYEPVPVLFGGETTDQYGITSSICYPNGFWGAYCGFLEAEYADYGRFKLCRTVRNHELLLYLTLRLRSHAGVVEQGENELHDVPYNIVQFVERETPELHAYVTSSERRALPSAGYQALFDDMVKVWDYTWEAAHEHRLFINRQQSGLHPAQFAVLHDATYQELVSMTAGNSLWDGVSLEPRTYFEQLRSPLTQTYEEETKRLSHLSEMNDAAKDKPELAEGLRDVSVYFSTGSFFEGLRHVANFELGLSDSERLLTPLLKLHLAGELSADELYTRVEPFMRDRYALGALEELNLYIAPMVYAGQDYSNDIGRSYAGFVRKISKAVTLGRRSRR